MPFRCRNCGEPAELSFCPRCGQRVDERRGPLLSLLGDALTEIFSLDGRHLRTAAALFRPGRLTRSHLEGRRASFVTPVRIYLVASLLFFFLVGFPPPSAETTNVLIDDHVVGGGERDPGKANLQLIDLGDDSSTWLGRRIASWTRPKLEELKRRDPQELLDAYFARFERVLPTALILFVPFLAAAIHLLHGRKAFYYVDHLVFALHFQSFLFVALVVAGLLLRATGAGFVGVLAVSLGVFLFVAPLYLALALRHVYRQGWRATVTKTLVLQLLYYLLSFPVLLATNFVVIHDI